MRITPHNISVHDILETPGHVSPRLYTVEGIHHGPQGGESVVELCPIDKASPSAHGKAQHMFVPMEMIEAGLTTGIFNLTRA